MGTKETIRLTSVKILDPLIHLWNRSPAHQESFSFAFSSLCLLQWLKQEQNLDPEHLLSREPASVSFSSWGQTCCHHFFSFCVQSWWGTEADGVSSFSVER